MTVTWMRLISTAYRLALTIILAGCGGGEPTRVDHTVTGTVKFNGAPVTEGSVQFEDSAKGLGGSGELAADGSYETLLPDGDYKVTILPPMEFTPDTPNSPGGLVPKNVKNVPDKYRTPDSTPLAARVTSGQTVHDFEMMP
ncbi:MAG: hypothetical protein ACK5Q5_13310 [Planctomycetaceae bacterium]